MKLYRIIGEQEEKETPKEVRKITSVHKRMLNALSRMDIKSDYPVIWKEIWDVFKINDYKLAQEIAYLYYEYDYLFDPDEKDSYHELPDDALEELDLEISSMDTEILALSKHLAIPPFLISEDHSTHYGLTMLYDEYGGGYYAIGEEDDVEEAMKEWSEEYFDDNGLSYVDRWYVDDYIELDSMNVEAFVEEYVEKQIDDMDEDDIIDAAGYDKDQMVDNRESMISNVVELKEEMESIQTEREGLQEVLDEMEEENEGAYETEEYQEIEEQQNDLEYQWDEKDSEVDDLEDEISDLEYEIENLLDTAKDELKESKVQDLIREIEDEGVDYFIDNFGYSLEDTVHEFCYFDEEGFVSSLADTEERNRLATYDDTEEEEEVNDIDYYIYRTE